MTTPTGLAWYVYAVIPAGGTAPNVAGLLADTTVDAIDFGPLSVLTTLVTRALFDSEHPDNRTSDPDWMAERATSHHAVTSAAAAQQACLPLGFGTLFSCLDRLAEWLRVREPNLLAGLATVAGQAEWCLTIRENTAAHRIWLDEHDSDLKRLTQQAENAGVGTAFLMAKRIEKARVAARIAHLNEVESRVGDLLLQTGWPHLAERRRDGSPSWSILAPPDAGNAPQMKLWLAGLAEALAPSGLEASLSGPWPAYAFAKAALREEAAHV